MSSNTREFTNNPRYGSGTVSLGGRCLKRPHFEEEGDEYMEQGLSDTNDKLRTLSANQVGWILESLTTLVKSETRGVLERDCEVLGVFLRIMNILSLDFQDKEAARDALPGMYAFDILKEGGNNGK